MTNKPMLIVDRELLEIYTGRKEGDWVEAGHELRALLDKEVDGNSHVPTQQGEPVARISLEQVRKAYDYANDHPHKYLRGTSNWCAAVAHSLNIEQPAPVAVVMPERDALRDLIAGAIGGDTYDCTRVWSAWGVGTMSEDDFVPVVEQDERLYEIADSFLAEVARLNGVKS